MRKFLPIIISLFFILSTVQLKATENDFSKLNADSAGITNLKVYPNPFVNELNLNFNSESEFKINVVIYNMIGKKVWEKEETVLTGSNTLNFELTELGNGIYYIKGTKKGSDNLYFIEKIVKK